MTLFRHGPAHSTQGRFDNMVAHIVAMIKENNYVKLEPSTTKIEVVAAARRRGT